MQVPHPNCGGKSQFAVCTVSKLLQQNCPISRRKRPQRRLRHLRGIAVRNLDLSDILNAAAYDHSGIEPAHSAGWQLQTGAAAGWVLRWSLWTWRPDSGALEHLYTSEPVPAIPACEWQPFCLELPAARASQVLHGSISGRVHLEVFATINGLNTPDSALPPSTAWIRSAGGDVSQCSPSVTSPLPPYLGRRSHSCSVADESGAAPLVRLRASDSGESVQLQWSGTQLKQNNTVMATVPIADPQGLQQSTSGNESSSSAAAATPSPLPPRSPGEPSAASRSAPTAAVILSAFAGTNGTGPGGVDGESEGGSDYETASEDGVAAALERLHSGSPVRLRPLSPGGPSSAKLRRGRSLDGATASCRAPSAVSPKQQRYSRLSEGGGGSHSRRSLLSADIDLDQLEFVGPELAVINMDLLPNTLLLELPGGWHAHPPPSGDLSPAASLAAAAVEAARASSLAAGFREYVDSDAELWQAPLQRLPLPAPSLEPESPLSPRSASPSLMASPLRGAATTAPAAANSDARDAATHVRLLLSAAADVALAQRRALAAEVQRDAAKRQLEKVLEQRETELRQQAVLRAAYKAHKRHEIALDAATAKQGSCRRAASLAHQIVLAQAQALLTALTAAQAAEERLTSANAMLSGERGTGRLRKLKRALVARRARMIAQLAAAFGLGFQTVMVMDVPAGGTLATRLDRHWFGGLNAPPPPPQSSQDAAEAGSSPAGCSDDGDDVVETSSAVAESAGSRVREVARLAIGGLELPDRLGQRGLDGLLGWDGDPAEELRVAAVLGYAAALADLMAAYLNVPLRYPILCAASRSAVLEAASPAGTYSSNIWPPPAQPLPDRQLANSVNADEWPLFYEGDRRTRFAYAIFALNKDIEQLLHAHGISSVGPHQVLPNLWTMASAAASALPHPTSTTPPPTPSTRSLWSDRAASTPPRHAAGWPPRKMRSQQQSRRTLQSQ